MEYFPDDGLEIDANSRGIKRSVTILLKVIKR